MATWNPWHGCRKISLGCLNCYVYRRDVEFGKDSIFIARTSSFDLPVKRYRKGIYKLQTVEWRPEAWKMIRERGDLHSVIIKNESIDSGLDLQKTGEKDMTM